METLVFDMGLSVDMSTLRNNTASQYDADGNLGYLAVAFPLTKWWRTSLGIMPLTDVNYQSTTSSAIDLGGEVKTVYEGVGGVSRMYWGNGLNLLGGKTADDRQLRIGFNLNYLYGEITRGVTYDFQANDTTYFMDSRRQKDTYIRNLTFDFGLQYEQPVASDYRLKAALTFTPHRNMTVKDNAMIYTFVTSAATEYMRDTIFPTDGNSEFESSLEQPWTLGAGLSFQRNDRWLVALDASVAGWSGLKYTENSSIPIFGLSPLRYETNSHVSLGVQMLGNRNATSYMRRITYSVGGHYDKGQLSLSLSDGRLYTLNEWGLGVGASLPMRKGRSVLNISLSYSSFGTADLLRRDVFSIGISVGSCESWFVKRKFN